MKKEHILAEIRRLAKKNGDNPPGVRRFATETGIRESDWAGIYWARWGDALIEAGFSPNVRQGRFDDDAILARLSDLTRELGRLPVKNELRMQRRTDSSFPSDTAIARHFGLGRRLAAKLLEFCRLRGEYSDVAEICARNTQSSNDDNESAESAVSICSGSVYLLKIDRFYKIGRSNATGRRLYELNTQYPKKARLVHEIKTDDPAGIEEYWHKRFASKRGNGEWFDLDANDVSAFRRRKFM